VTKEEVLRGRLPSKVGASLTVRHMGAIFAELRGAKGEIRAEFPYLGSIVIWDASIAEVKSAGVLFRAVAPRVLLVHHDEIENTLYVVEAEYPAPP